MDVQRQRHCKKRHFEIPHIRKSWRDVEANDAVPQGRHMEKCAGKIQIGRSVEIVLTVDKDNTIHLTRGDTARFAIGRVVNTVTKTNYTPTTEVTQ